MTTPLATPTLLYIIIVDLCSDLRKKYTRESKQNSFALRNYTGVIAYSKNTKMSLQRVDNSFWVACLCVGTRDVIFLAKRSLWSMFLSLLRIHLRWPNGYEHSFSVEAKHYLRLG